MIEYVSSLGDVEEGDLEGFFADWPHRPSHGRHLEVLRGSEHVVLARETASGKVVGFVTAVGDGVLTAFVPLLEVLPEYRDRGIGSELVRRVLALLEGPLFDRPRVRRRPRPVLRAVRTTAARGDGAARSKRARRRAREVGRITSAPTPLSDA